MTREQFHPFYLRLDCGSEIPFATCVGLAADHMLSAEKLYSCTNAELNAHAWVMLNAYDMKKLLDKELSGTPKAEAVSEYFNGLLNNFDHFNDDGAAAKRFKNALQDAVTIAKQAHREDDFTKAQFLYHKALVYCAFACHFLTDCFSAGHMRTPRRAIYESCKSIYGADHMPGVHLLLLLSTGQDVPCTSAQVIAALYALAAHNFDSAVGVRVRVRDGDKTIEYTAKGDGHTGTDPVGVLYARKSVALARLAVFQARFWGRCDYSYDPENDPFQYLPRVADPSEAPIVVKNGVVGGWLWDQTASNRKPRTVKILKLVYALNQKREEYDRKLDKGHVPPVTITAD